MTDLADFLLARIAEDETTTRCADGDRLMRISQADDTIIADAGFMQAFTPARVLAECEAKRRIVEQLWLYVAAPEPASSDPSGTQAVWIVKQLALPYADHPDYDPSWRPPS